MTVKKRKLINGHPLCYLYNEVFAGDGFAGNCDRIESKCQFFFFCKTLIKDSLNLH